jgi:hypothetical protein
LGLALGTAVLTLGGEALATPLDPGPGGDTRSLRAAVLDDGAARLSHPRTQVCTLARCGPRPGDSPWTLAGFGLAALGAGWLGGRRPAPQSRTQSANG